jgi:hypothetical protein
MKMPAFETKMNIASKTRELNPDGFSPSDNNMPT